MTCRDIYALAAQLIPASEAQAGCEFGCVTSEAEDFTQRVPTVMNAVIIELESLAQAFVREDEEREKGLPFTIFFVRNMDDPLPLPDRFRMACAYYLAMHFVLAQDAATAKMIHNLYLDAVDDIRREISAVVGGMKDVYGL